MNWRRLERNFNGWVTRLTDSIWPPQRYFALGRVISKAQIAVGRCTSPRESFR